jgi:hypothetical protein
MRSNNNASSSPAVSIWDRSSLLIVSGLLIVGTLKAIGLMFYTEPDTMTGDDVSAMYNPSMAGDDE